MKYILTVLSVLFLVGCSELTTTQVVDKVQDGVVLIAVESPTKSGMGSGFILEDNQIVTNNHVIEGGKDGKIVVFSKNSGTKYEAEIVYTDIISDVAVIRLKDWEMFEAKEKPANLKLGNSDKEKVGNPVIVIGHPWGFTWSVSEGIISGKSRRPELGPKFVDQLDAHVYNGNSGGPIFNHKGEIVCVSNLMYAREGGSYGFCIPSILVKKVVYDFNAFKEVRWRVINISVGLSEDGSAVIAKDVEPQGAAGMAGVKDGDKILKISSPNNHPGGIMIKSPDDLITELASLNGDEEVVKLTLERNGKKLEVDVKTNFKLSKDF